MTGTRVLEQSCQQVRRLAERHPDDWLGQDLVGDAPLRIFAGAGVPRRVLVVTKEPALRRWPKPDWPSGLVLVAASGIVTKPQAAILEKLASDRSAPIAFVGDADPMARVRRNYLLKVGVIVLIHALAALSVTVVGRWWLAASFAFAAALFLWRGVKDAPRAD